MNRLYFEGYYTYGTIVTGDFGILIQRIFREHNSGGGVQGTLIEKTSETDLSMFLISDEQFVDAERARK